MTARSFQELRRRIGVALTLTYLMVVGLAPLAHAWLENGPEITTQAHLHNPGHDCPPPHDEQHCPACEFAGIKPLPASAFRLPERPAVRVLAAVFRDVPATPRTAVLTRGPRAPPAV